MTRLISVADVRRIACIGTGVIGAGWAAHFLSRGFDVVGWDPHPEARERAQCLIDQVWPTMAQLGLTDGASPSRLTLTDKIETAMDGAQFVQENAPERLALKQELLARVDALAPPDIVISSSTSGFPVSELQARCAHPERVVVGHPFNPPYLMPLVEVLGGGRTAQDAVDWAAAFYNSIGKVAIKLKAEMPGFVANRLQEAIWREALQLIAGGKATVEDINRAMVYGPGLRWAFMGPFLQSQLTGGAGGIEHSLNQFTPEIRTPWCHAPMTEMTPELRKTLIDGAHRAAAGRSTEQLIEERDRVLVALLNALKTSGPMDR
jgi:carnitine 3-dehydrogenase